MELDRSMELLERAKEIIPLQAQTFSKSPAWFPFGAYPVYLEHGRDGRVIDVDGNEFVDLICGLGAISLGYQYFEVDKAIMDQLTKGIIFSLPHPLEVELADLLKQVIPSAEMSRFCKNGTDATTAAVRLARAITGREKVANFGYHGGGSDWYGAGTDRPAGIPKVLKDYIIPFKYNDLQSLEAVFQENPDEIACVIMEPVIFTPPERAFLHDCMELAHLNKALFILDETLTGFRWALGGAQEYFKIVPDLACFGKAMANGMPIAALVGKVEYMTALERLPIFFSYTFAGECLSLAAAIATIKEMRDHNTITTCWQRGHLLTSGLISSGMKIVGYSCRPHLTWEGDETLSRSLFMEELASRGVLAHSVGINLCASHTVEDIRQVTKAVLESWSVVRDAQEKGKVRETLKGKPIVPVFQRL